MDAQQHIEAGKNLSAFMGEDKFHSVCKEIASTITTNNLDATPGVLKDLFGYIADEVAISRI
jgi:hypothetical protein